MRLITYTLFLIFTVIFSACEDSIDMSQFNENFCELNSLALLEPTKEYDFIEYRAARRQESMTTFDTLSMSGHGEACINASDLNACEEALNSLELESEFISYGVGLDRSETHYSLAYTNADEVSSLNNFSDTLEFLGQIDTSGEAALIASLKQRLLVCGQGANVGPHSKGFVIHVTTGDACGLAIERHVDLVKEDGTITRLQSVLVEGADPNCLY